MDEKSKQDQDLAKLRDSLPRFWWSVYQGCREAGFSEPQAFALVQTFILASHCGGVRPDRSSPDDTQGERD